MMTTVPTDIRELLDELVECFKNTIQNNLIGMYLHGSLAMGCFNLHSSDVDFLVVVNQKLSADIKKQIIRFTLLLSEKAPVKGLEFSVVLKQDLKQFVYPTPFELHFSNMWKARYLAGTVDFEMHQADPDLAAHFVITRARGICLYGEPIKRIFQKVPDAAYLQSIMGDAQDIFENITENPVYGVLNLCRVLAYKTDGLITSKAEGGEWALQHLDTRYRPMLQQALSEYQSLVESHAVWSETELEAFASYIRGQLKTASN